MSKIIGKHRQRTPEENLRKLGELCERSGLLRPYKKIKGLILRFKTWDELYQFTITRASKKI